MKVTKTIHIDGEDIMKMILEKIQRVNGCEDIQAQDIKLNVTEGRADEGYSSPWGPQKAKINWAEVEIVTHDC